ncbi:MAG: methionine synthase [Gemmatales bacterium]|nr:methionine synthase [Gemmatales bacterium]MDW8386603.1 methionine synthase [Gemmatales bacterium]
MSDFLEVVRQRVVILDGAMGTNIHRHEPSLSDFGGKENCVEWLNLTRPDIIHSIHTSFLEVGCDAVETNTFGATRLTLSEFQAQEYVTEINRRAVQIAREAVKHFSTPDHPRFVIGSIGPGTRPVSLVGTAGRISFDECHAVYSEQIRVLLESGVDVLLIETCFDILQAKAAAIAAADVMQALGLRVPLMVQVTIETTGTMLAGTDIASALTTLEGLPMVDVIGINCATGPKEMEDHIRHLSHYCRRFISCLPNAGIPENVGGKAVFPLRPKDLAESLAHFVHDFGINIVGGCCGTTPEHLAEVVRRLRSVQPQRRQPIFEPSVSSLFQSVPLRMQPGPLIVGERTNTTGSRKFKQLLEADDIEGMIALAREQQDEGAHLLDVCVAYPGRDEVRDIVRILERFNEAIRLPLVIDTTEWQVMEAGLKCCSGKPILNSINLEEGRKKLDIVAPLAKRFGAALVALSIDEEGQATTADWKFRVAKRIYDICTQEYGFDPADLMFDPLTLPVTTGQPELYNAAVETLEAIRRIRAELPGASTWLGLSNISFGLDPYPRQVVNSVFLRLALDAGLDIAILNASKILPLHEIDPEGRELARRLLLNDRRDGDPLQAIIAHYSKLGGKKTTSRKAVHLGDTVEERLKQAIIQGRRDSLYADLDTARQKYSPLDIINKILLEGMKVVGDLFASGEMQLPFVLQSAEVMKAAVKYLEQFMEKATGAEKGRLVLATVKGDVHDIGKNLVDIILTNNGYKVYNLGIKQSIETILQAALEHHADAIGMSGLLVKSTVVMKENLEILNERGITLPVICGGAALTRRYVEETLRSVYRGPVYYGQDAFAGLRLMDELCDPRRKLKRARERGELLQSVPRPGEVPDLATEPAENGDFLTPAERPVLAVTHRSVPLSPDIPNPPFLGVRVVRDIPMAEVFPFLNVRTLFSTQWQLRRNNVKPVDYERMLKEFAYPTLERLKRQCLQENLLQPAAVYGFFPAAGEGNDLIIFEEDRRTERLRFTFPRQESGDRLCLSDYFRPRGPHGAEDFACFFVVTVGREVGRRTQELFENHHYSEYLYLHGLSVESAEALAEYFHKRIRHEWGIGQHDAAEIQKLFKLHYRGCRYSFGYPACPNLEDQVKLFELLHPEQIDVSLTESFLLDPEQSTSALVVHHPLAKYFNVKSCLAVR